MINVIIFGTDGVVVVREEVVKGSDRTLLEICSVFNGWFGKAFVADILWIVFPYILVDIFYFEFELFEGDLIPLKLVEMIFDFVVCFHKKLSFQ